MTFTGKHGDTFEAAFTQLLVCIGRTHIPWIDCAGLRCFGFQADGSMETWFQPYGSLPDTVAALSDALAVKLHSQREQAGKGFRFPNGCDAVLIGPLLDGAAVSELQDSYYHGNGRFLVVKKASEEQVEIFDPRGFDGLLVPYDKLELPVSAQGAFSLWLSACESPRMVLSPEELLRRGLAYHDSIAGEELCSLERACGRYTANARNELTLRYGVLNMLQQLDKVFSLAETCGWKTALSYREKKQALFTCGLTGNVFNLPEAVIRIWRILDERR